MQPYDDHDAAGIAEQFETISLTVLAAHETPLRDASDGEQWERRGLLQRLVRRPQSR
jgi:hypothetical protein